MHYSLVAAHDSKTEKEFSILLSCFCYGPEFARGILGFGHTQTPRIRGIEHLWFEFGAFEGAQILEILEWMNL